MLYTHTIGRIGKDCKVITGVHGTFMAVDIAVDDYSKGQNVTTWVRVRSSRENHIRLADYLTKGRLILVEGTISTSQWMDRQGESHVQVSINADSIAFVNAGRKEEQSANPKQAFKKGAKAKKNTPELVLVPGTVFGKRGERIGRGPRITDEFEVIESEDEDDLPF